MGYIAGSANGRAVTSTSTLVTTSTLTTTATPPFVKGLQLVMALEPANLAQGQNLTISAWVYNPTSTTITETSAGIDNPTQDPCVWEFGPAVVIYKGAYTFGDISGASPLLQYNATVVLACIAPIRNTYTFQPYDANSSHEEITIGGYYVRNGSGPYRFQPFPAGAYTVVVFDSWGHQALAQFSVAPATSSVATPQNLRLGLTLNSSELHPGEYVTMNASLTNTLSTSNNVTDAYQWLIKGLDVGYACLQYPFGVGVIKGYYTTQNVSTGTLLDMFKPGPPIECPVNHVQYFDFQPGSDIVVVNQFNEKLQMNVTVTIGGYWTGYWNPQSGLPPPTFHRFENGIYTVVAADEWGNILLLYFSVT